MSLLWSDAITPGQRSSLPYSPHPFKVLCRDGHLLSNDIFRCSTSSDPKHRNDLKIWASTACNLDPKNDPWRANIPKTMERIRLDPFHREFVMKRDVFCGQCPAGSVRVGVEYRNYADCSDFCVDVGNTGRAPRYRSAALAVMFHCQDAQLKVRLNDGVAQLSLAQIAAVVDARVDSEQLLRALLDDEPVLSDVFPERAQPHHNWLLAFEMSLKTSQQRYMLASAMSLYVSRQLELLHTQITVVGEFLFPSGGRKLVKRRMHKVILAAGAPNLPLYLPIVESAFTKRNKFGAPERLQFLTAQLDDAQACHMPDPPENPFSNQKLHALCRVRHVLAHSRDENGCERRHILRLFVQYFGQGEIDATIKFMTFCIEKLEFDTQRPLWATIVDVARAEMAEKTARDNLTKAVEPDAKSMAENVLREAAKDLAAKTAAETAVIERIRQSAC